jgi:hypothetical protein
MARTNRDQVFDPFSVGTYHVFNRTARKLHLMGVDAVSGKELSHRKKMVVEKLRGLSKYFCIDVFAYAVLSNHFHLVLRNRPDSVEKLSDAEVAVRWLMICSTGRNEAGEPLPPTESQINAALKDAEKIAVWRLRLSNPSWLMKMACQFIATRCNKEDGCTGKFFAERFKMVALLDEPAVIACMAYVDLNPIRAGLAGNFEEFETVSIRERLGTLDGSKVTPEQWLVSLPRQHELRERRREVLSDRSGHLGESVGLERGVAILATSTEIEISIEDYTEMLHWLAIKCRPNLVNSLRASEATEQLLESRNLDPLKFTDTVRNFRQLFLTAAGGTASVARETQRRAQRWTKAPGRKLLDPTNLATTAP